MGIREDEHNHKHFEESDIDAGELEAEIGKISRNCLYDVFSSIIDTLEESGGSWFLGEFKPNRPRYTTGTKRGRSPNNITPEDNPIKIMVEGSNSPKL